MAVSAMTRRYPAGTYSLLGANRIVERSAGIGLVAEHCSVVFTAMSKLRDQKLATILAFAGTVTLPGLHKFYVGQKGWGVTYLLFLWTGIPQVASAIEGVWYLSQDQAEFDQKFNGGLLLETTANQATPADPARVSALAQALRQLDSLRQEGLISEYEFEQKRRQLLE